MKNMLNQNAIEYVTMLRETAKLAQEERWIFGYLIGRLHTTLDPRHPSDVLRWIRDVVGHNMSAGMADCCYRLEACVARGDEWHA